MDNETKEMLKSAQSGTARKGKTDYIKYLNGKRITRSQSINAKCFTCNGMGELGECDITTCPLFPYSPYRRKA